MLRFLCGFLCYFLLFLFHPVSVSFVNCNCIVPSCISYPLSLSSISFNLLNVNVSVSLESFINKLLSDVSYISSVPLNQTIVISISNPYNFTLPVYSNLNNKNYTNSGLANQFVTLSTTQNQDENQNNFQSNFKTLSETSSSSSDSPILFESYSQMNSNIMNILYNISVTVGYFPSINSTQNCTCLLSSSSPFNQNLNGNLTPSQTFLTEWETFNNSLSIKNSKIFNTTLVSLIGTGVIYKPNINNYQLCGTFTNTQTITNTPYFGVCSTQNTGNPTVIQDSKGTDITWQYILSIVLIMGVGAAIAFRYCYTHRPPLRDSQGRIIRTQNAQDNSNTNHDYNRIDSNNDKNYSYNSTSNGNTIRNNNNNNNNNTSQFNSIDENESQMNSISLNDLPLLNLNNKQSSQGDSSSTSPANYQTNSTNSPNVINSANPSSDNIPLPSSSSTRVSHAKNPSTITPPTIGVPSFQSNSHRYTYQHRPSLVGLFTTKELNGKDSLFQNPALLALEKNTAIDLDKINKAAHHDVEESNSKLHLSIKKYFEFDFEGEQNNDNNNNGGGNKYDEQELLNGPMEEDESPPMPPQD